jgi:peptidoglycan/xylan/chitin deacetylase (PgdA/CDA1 family)
MTILCYHEVDPTWDSPLAVTPDQFARHVAWLSRQRTVTDLSDAVEKLDPSGRLPRGIAALTFDDGFAGVYEYSLPILTRAGLPFTVFLVARTLHDRDWPIDWVRDPGRRLLPLSLDQAIEMKEAGVGFGSHSLAHRDLTQLSDAECERDLRTSRETIQDLLGMPVPYLAYPAGRHDPRVWRTAHRAGFTHAFSLPDRREHIGPYAIPRTGVYRGNRVTALRIKSARWYLPVRTMGRKLYGPAQPGGEATPSGAVQEPVEPTPP